MESLDTENRADSEQALSHCGESVLVLGPVIRDAVTAVTGELVGDGVATDLVAVAIAIARGPDRLLQSITTHTSGRPARVAAISVDSVRGSASAAPAGGGQFRSVAVADAGDLTGIGIRIDQCFSAWAASGHRTVLCFDSLTMLLQYTEFPAVFRLCHAITRKGAGLDVRSVFALDPRTVND